MTTKFSETQISQMFNAISKSYDRVNRILSFGIDQRWRKKLAQELPEGTELQLLDLATGTGDQLIALMQTGKFTSAMGIDLAEEMLNKGKEKIARTPFANLVDLQVGSALQIPTEEKVFDCVTISFGIRNVSDPLVCLKEMKRVLAPKGKAFILEFSLPRNRLIRTFHLFYLRRLLPFVGGFFSKKKEAYHYLNQTIEAFPYGEQFLTLMREAGFTQSKALPLTFGVATLYIGENS